MQRWRRHIDEFLQGWRAMRRPAARVREARRRVLTAGGLAAGSAVFALPARAAETRPDEEKPFAEHRLALQLSDRAQDKQGLILSVCYNILKAYGPDLVAINVVTFGPGIDLLRAASPHRAKVDSLIAQGVRFDVCMNTVDTIERETGKKVDLNPQAQKVQVGVARIIDLCENKYVLVRP
jgi:intracellular sulfur oxidation DsrE/DsrF family protein